MSLKSASKLDYSLRNEGSANYDEIKTGCLQRIADATEAMAKYHVQIIKDRDMYERWYRDSQAGQRILEKSNAALRGVITKLKKARP